MGDPLEYRYSFYCVWFIDSGDCLYICPQPSTASPVMKQVQLGLHIHRMHWDIFIHPSIHSAPSFSFSFSIWPKQKLQPTLPSCTSLPPSSINGQPRQLFLSKPFFAVLFATDAGSHRHWCLCRRSWFPPHHQQGSNSTCIECAAIPQMCKSLYTHSLIVHFLTSTLFHISSGIGGHRLRAVTTQTHTNTHPRNEVRWSIC